VHDGESAARVNGFGNDGDGNHVDIVGVGSKRIGGSVRCDNSLKEICVSPRQRRT
jgi:hypothetical protein